LQAEECKAGRHVGHRGGVVACERPAQERFEPAGDEIGADHHVAVVRQPREGAIHPHAAAVMADGGVDDLANRDTSRLGHDDAVEHGAGVSTLQEEFAHEGHVEKTDVFAHGPVLGLDERPVPLALERLADGRRLGTEAGEEVGPLPTSRGVETPPVSDEPLVHG